MRICSRQALILSAALPRDCPGARLNDTVIDCSCPVWLIAIGPTSRRTVAMLDSGTSAPPRART